MVSKNLRPFFFRRFSIAAMVALIILASQFSSGAAQSAAGEYLIDVWQTDQGLPQNTVTALKQTRDGYIWIGTLGGLVRFDGIRFTMFGGGVLGEGARDQILCLHEDAAGTLWIGTAGGGISRYAHGRFASLSLANGSAENDVVAIQDAGDGTIWIGTSTGLYSWSRGAARPEPFDSSGTSPNRIYDLNRGKSGVVWLAGGERVGRIEKGHFTTELSSQLFNGAEFRVVHEDAAGNVWMGSEGPGLLRLREGKLTAFGEANGLAGGRPWAVCESRAGDLWVGMERGLSRLRNGRWITFTIAEGLANNSVRALLEDREGNLWVGTDGGGLNRLKHRQVYSLTVRDGLTHESALALCENSAGGIWIGLNGGGVNEYRAGRITKYSESAVLPPNAAVFSLLSGRDGGFWIGTFGDGLFRVQEGQTARYSSELGAGPDKVLALYEDPAGTLWVGTYTGLFELTKEGRFIATDIGAASRSPVTSILRDREGVLWVGTSGAGLVSRRGTNVFARTRGAGLSSNFVRALREDAEGAIWIGTGGGGLARWKGGELKSLDTESGLIDNVISQILEDDAGNLWLGSNRGIMKVRKKDLDAVLDGREQIFSGISYGRDEGMPGLECSGGFQPAALRTRDGSLWFSTVKGVVRIDPTAVRPNTVPPSVRIEQIVLDGRSIIPTAPSDTSEPRSVQIRPGNRRMEFQFAALTFVAPDKARFKYQLSGYDPGWVEGGASRSATYTEVPPGDYRFRLMACNNDGVWNEMKPALALTVEAPFWKEWWFFLATGCAFAALVGGTVRFFSGRKLKRKLQRLEEQHAVEKERARIAQDMHDEIGAKLTKISFLSGVAQRALHEPKQAEKEIETISHTARDLLRGLDEIVWAVSPQNDTLDNLATYICQHSDEFFKQTNIHCHLDIPTQLPELPLSADLRHNVFLVVKEALTNVLKHSGATEVKIRLEIHRLTLSVCVEDNGRGFAVEPAKSQNEKPPEESGRVGNGLRNMRQRVEESGGRFVAETAPAGGARIWFSVQLKPRD
jgi:ligand-binding sensor domain-containing protein/signal transduction histidine kinase